MKNILKPLLLLFLLQFFNKNIHAQLYIGGHSTSGVSEELPKFPGGQKALSQYIKQHLKIPVKAIQKNIHGRVIVMFIIEINGSLNDIQINRGLGYGIDEAVLSLLKNMPKWEPGRQNGQAYRVRYVIPVEI